MKQLGASMERSLERFFTKWGTSKWADSTGTLNRNEFIQTCKNFVVCAAYPVVTIVSGLIVAAILSAGIVYLEVTIDPIEIWASPESRSRIEKTHFDESFTPFYRTAQVILHAESLEPVCLSV